MLIAGIIGREKSLETANLINSILSSTGKKTSIVDSKDLTGLDARLLKGYINELERNNVDILLLKLNITGLEKEIFDNLHFDIMIYNDKADDLKGVNVDDYTGLMRKVFSLLDEKGTAIVNADHSELIRFLQGIKRYVVTYGFNPKASITASSIGDAVCKDGFLCCLQRTISARNGVLIEPQEYRLKVPAEESDTYNVLAAATFALVNGIDLNV